jgi:hypothetical protein
LGYRPDPDLLAHVGLVGSGGGRRTATIRPEGRGRPWQVVNEDKTPPYMKQDPLIRDFHQGLKKPVAAPERQVLFRMPKESGRSGSRSVWIATGPVTYGPSST